MTSFVAGETIWVDVSTPDRLATIAFYQRLFRWQMHPQGAQLHDYTIMTYEGRQVCGIGTHVAHTARPSWIVYFKVSDTRTVAQATLARGGRVLHPPTDVRNDATFAILADPSGAIFGIAQPRENLGLEIWGQLGGPRWVQLNSVDPDASLSFYRAVFGWTDTHFIIDQHPYRLVAAHNGQRSFGGIFKIGDIPAVMSPPPQWCVYFEVDNCDDTITRATQLDGTVNQPVVSIDMVGRVAVLTDPYQATFGIISSEYPI